MKMNQWNYYLDIKNEKTFLVFSFFIHQINNKTEYINWTFKF